MLYQRLASSTTHIGLTEFSKPRQNHRGHFKIGKTGCVANLHFKIQFVRQRKPAWIYSARKQSVHVSVMK